MTSTSSAADTGLPSTLDPALMQMFSADSWNEVGMTCRLALVTSHFASDDLAEKLGDLIDGDPRVLAGVLDDRERHRKVLQRALALLRAVDRNYSAALDKALTASGH